METAEEEGVRGVALKNGRAFCVKCMGTPEVTKKRISSLARFIGLEDLKNNDSPHFCCKCKEAL